MRSVGVAPLGQLNRWRLAVHRVHVDRVAGRGIHHRRPLVEHFVQPPPVEEEEQDALPPLDHVLVGVDGFEVTGAEPQDADTFLALLPPSEAASFREQLSNVFPLPLSRIDQAQQELLLLAGALADEELI